jgi:hypothetical protein
MSGVFKYIAICALGDQMFIKTRILHPAQLTASSGLPCNSQFGFQSNKSQGRFVLESMCNVFLCPLWPIFLILKK